MTRIDPKVLRAERERKDWSLEDLARRSGVDAQSIHRIEKGGQRSNRRTVIENLTRALGVSEDFLTGAAAPSVPEKEMDEIDELSSSSQLNLRVSNRTRNALSLTANRYGVTHAQIVEIAPLLFCWAAEQSLRQRRDRIAEIEQKNHELAQLGPSHLHAAAFANQRSEGTLRAEAQSVENNDLFGKLIDGDGYESYLPDDYEEATKNPFTVFLCGLTGELGELATFVEWDPDSSPEYTVCRPTVVKYVAGDNEAADEILDGYLTFHKLLKQLPKELREEGKGAARAKWVRDEVAARRKEISQRLNLTGLGI
jgi:transcriptional regulator with XRE-family HTH domain